MATAIVAVSTAVRFAFAQRIAAGGSSSTTDLLELARSVADEGRLLIRGEPSYGYGVVYPLLVSPAYALFDSLPAAYDALKAINSLLVARGRPCVLPRAARPPPRARGVRLAARRVGSVAPVRGRGDDRERLYAFSALRSRSCSLERPTPLRQGVLLAVCVLAYLTRAQALAFFAAAAVAPFLVEELAVVPRSLRGVRGRRRRHPRRPARARRVAASSGRLRGHRQHRYEPGEVARWLLYHLAELDVHLGIFPFAASLVLLALWVGCRGARPSSPRQRHVERLPAARGLGVRSLPSVGRIEERNLFYLAPLG